MAGRLNAKRVASAEVGKHADGDGLWLYVDKNGARRKWWFVFTWENRRPEMSLGDANDISLLEAREKATEARRLVRDGVNPIEARRQSTVAEKAATFGEVADAYFEAKKGEYRNDKYREMVRVALTRTLEPLRSLPVASIDTEAVLAALKPVWGAAPETGKRLREKVAAVLDAATAKGLRSGENPARWKGHLEHLLPKRLKVEKAHHAAMLYPEVPAFVARLLAEDAMAARALAFCILTAARSGEVYGAHWSEIDLEGRVWTVPAKRMKAGREHRVPLSDAAMEILAPLAAARTCDFVFPSPRGARPLSHVAMAKAMDRLGATGATVHGFRSSFRDFAGHETHFPREICEQALAHRLGDSAELSYKRGDFLEKRRELMAAWAAHCAPRNADNVLRFTKSGGSPAA